VPKPDHVCILPTNPAWIRDRAYLADVLETVVGPATRWSPVPTSTSWWLAIGVLRDLPDATEPRGGSFLLLPLPAHKLEALWQVRAALAAAVEHEADTESLLSLLQDYLDITDRTPDGLLRELDTILAVLTLDLPAAHTVATTLLLDGDRDEAFHTAYRQITTAWAAAGINH
jgi:hypothetical protein